jgi:hypothetical protein
MAHGSHRTAADQHEEAAHGLGDSATALTIPDLMPRYLREILIHGARAVVSNSQLTVTVSCVIEFGE